MGVDGAASAVAIWIMVVGGDAGDGCLGADDRAVADGYSRGDTRTSLGRWQSAGGDAFVHLGIFRVDACTASAAPRGVERVGLYGSVFSAGLFTYPQNYLVMGEKCVDLFRHVDHSRDENRVSMGLSFAEHSRHVPRFGDAAVRFYAESIRSRTWMTNTL